MMQYALTTLPLCLLLSACLPDEIKPFGNSNNVMRTEFLEHCQDLPENISRKRAGTLDKYCFCIFDKTMKGLTEEERTVAGFYLYGSSSEGYMERYPYDVQDAVDNMMTASQAIDHAVKSCRW